MNTNQQTVLDFLAAIKSRDMERIMGFFSWDPVFHNIPWEPLAGFEVVRDFLQTMVDSSTELDWQVHNIAETDAGAVLTERTDRFRFGDKPIEVPVMGIFELQNGKITAWRDYFDTKQVSEQLPRNSYD